MPAALKVLSRRYAQSDIITMFRMTQEHDLPREIRHEILKNAADTGTGAFKVATLRRYKKTIYFSAFFQRSGQRVKSLNHVTRALHGGSD